MIRFFAVAMMLVATGAHAGRFDTIEYECRRLDRGNDGIQCGVVDGRLLIRVVTRHNDPEPLRERTNYVIATTIHNFIAFGGVEIVMRSRNERDQVIERGCARRPGRAREHCADWHVIDGDAVLGKSKR